MENASQTGMFQPKKLSDELTEFSLGNRKFLLNEMKIGRTKEFVRLVVESFDRLRLSFPTPEDGKDSQELELNDIVENLGDAAFDELTKMFNFAFEYRNKDYEPVSVEWLTDNLSIREMGVVFIEVLRMNKLEWLLPFFRDKFLEGMNQNL